MYKRFQVILNEEEQKELEDIKQYYETLFSIKLNISQLLRFVLQKEWKWEHGIELMSNKMDN